MAIVLPKLFDPIFLKDPFEMMEFSIKGIEKFNFLKENYEILHEDGKFVVVCCVPSNVDMNDIHVDVNKETGLLSVKSKKEEEKKEEVNGKTFYLRGESKCSYALYLPEDVDLDAHTVTCNNGQLKVSFDSKGKESTIEPKSFSIPIETQSNKV
ncbi:MAG: hypothetical protein S4CHLAM6_06580 [Chlamydiae bacterium]|nr:hypothetical protein [Chlamydiota bacterium]